MAHAAMALRQCLAAWDLWSSFIAIRRVLPDWSIVYHAVRLCLFWHKFSLVLHLFLGSPHQIIQHASYWHRFYGKLPPCCTLLFLQAWARHWRWPASQWLGIITPWSHGVKGLAWGFNRGYQCNGGARTPAPQISNAEPQLSARLPAHRRALVEPSTQGSELP